MNGPHPSTDDKNPFCAGRLRPGTIPFVFAHGHSLAQLVEQLGRTKWRGAIVGPHGSGKSTLLADLLAEIERTGRRAVRTTLRAAQRRLPAEFRAAVRRSRQAVVAIDGCEQLRPWTRLMVKWHCQRRDLGLVVTSHRSAGLPELYRTAIDVPLAWRVVERLQEGFPPRVRLADVVEGLARHHGNLREAIFDLYDVYEERQ